jgi:diadenosine tetraphosphate (Ap4A) HIT family hydrolase
MEGCVVCLENDAFEDDPFFVAKTRTGFVRLNKNQFYGGYTLFACNQHVEELHELRGSDRDQHLHEMALVAEAVFMAFRPRKLNYEALGNSAPHLHWHLIPRHADDPRPDGPVWENLDFLRSIWTHQGMDASEIEKSRDHLRTALRTVGAPID